MVQGIKISLPKGGGTSKTRGRSNGSPEKKKAFPTTPRSIEKQKKILQANLKKVMETNLRLKAHNRCLKDTNQKYLDVFAGKDVECQKQKQLNQNAMRELNFKVLIFHKIKENLA